MSRLRMPAGYGQAEVERKKSRFIAQVWPVHKEAEALAALDRVRAEHKKAAHHVYAYRLEKDRQIVRYSDDGEPGGTAGRPVLDVIQGEELDRILVVVTRYFGGTLLGSGGLVRAYSQAAREGIRAAGMEEYRTMARCRIVIPYEFSGRADYYFAQAPRVLADTQYRDAVIYTVYIPPEQLQSTADELADMTGGRNSFQMEEQVFLPVKT